uniref:PEHE domain-containing protein n=2 Tax=Photinus pyralis TaxID=7054 RepID=A0A1Y1MA03_PHOPY
MQIKVLNNDHNINRRLLTKMSEDCCSQNNVNLTGCLENLNSLNNIVATEKIDLNLPYDHMYASNTENFNLINNSNFNCQNAENEVKFLKDWLLTNLDLIQQQNDEILNKEKTIHILKQENEMLKERINCLDNSAYQSTDLNHYETQENSCGNVLEEMTHDASHADDNTKSATYVEPQSDIKEPIYEIIATECRHAQDIFASENNATKAGTTEGISDDMVNSSVDDTLKDIKMSIRRKRLCSSSSVISNTEVSLEESHSSRKKKKRKSSLRDDKILMSADPYVTQSGNLAAIPQELDSSLTIPSATNLEVPRWRVKVYTSCYSMEGTENLDDEVYNKRHMRLENDERRRKRWDVQRIREQRIVDKLKQRQERVGSGSRVDDQIESVVSLWPPLEDIKYLEVCDNLPVSAFGAPIVRFTPMEFSLPWLNNSEAPQDTSKKHNHRKSTIKRKATKR